MMFQRRDFLRGEVLCKLTAKWVALFKKNLKKRKKVTVKDAISELYALEKKDEKKLNGKLDNNYIKYLRKKNSKVLMSSLLDRPLTG